MGEVWIPPDQKTVRLQPSDDVASVTLDVSSTRAIKANTVKLKVSDFEDLGAAIGRYLVPTKLPAGSTVVGVKVQTLEGFTGDTHAKVTVRNDDTTAHFTPSGAQTGFETVQTKYGRPAASDGVIDADTTIRVSIIGDSDFTLITAGKLIVSVYYLDFNAV